MAAEPVLIVKCDAPGCGALLETRDRKPVFASMEDVNDAAEEHDWLITKDHKGLTRTYCRRHWREQFSMRVPYWGARKRSAPGEEEAGF